MKSDAKLLIFRILAKLGNFKFVNVAFVFS